jgi:heme exporter protein D
MSLNDFFSMGGYATYVWSAYGVSFIILFLNIILAIRKERKTMHELKSRLQRDKK